jgi:hypothetical protein
VLIFVLEQAGLDFLNDLAVLRELAVSLYDRVSCQRIG